MYMLVLTNGHINGLQLTSDGLQPTSDGFQPNSDGLQLTHERFQDSL